jgi:hypothetical protein
MPSSCRVISARANASSGQSPATRAASPPSSSWMTAYVLTGPRHPTAQAFLSDVAARMPLAAPADQSRRHRRILLRLFAFACPMRAKFFLLVGLQGALKLRTQYIANMATGIVMHFSPGFVLFPR